VSFTYEDQVLSVFTDPYGTHELNQRNVGVSIPGRRVTVPKSHPRNQDGEYFSVLVTRTTNQPKPGSDEISRADEESWIGTDGYLKSNGTRQKRAIAFQGHVHGPNGPVREVFVVDLPDDLTQPGLWPLPGTDTRRPAPPRGVVQRRITFTTHLPNPGISGPRHWLRTSPDGSKIGFLRRDANGIAQFWIVSPNGGEAVQITHQPHPVASAFTWHPDGKHVAFVWDTSVCVMHVGTGKLTRLTPRCDAAIAPRPEACVFSPDGSRIAFVRHLPDIEKSYNQICVVDVP
jgi:WD40 repeat protein